MIPEATTVTDRYLESTNTDIDLDIIKKLCRRHKVGRNYSPEETTVSAVAPEDRATAKHRLDALTKANCC